MGSTDVTYSMPQTNGGIQRWEALHDIHRAFHILAEELDSYVALDTLRDTDDIFRSCMVAEIGFHIVVVGFHIAVVVLHIVVVVLHMVVVGLHVAGVGFHIAVVGFHVDVVGLHIVVVGLHVDVVGRRVA